MTLSDLEGHFWATVKRFALSYRTIVCLSVQSLCNVGVCGQTVGWIKMKLGTKVGLVPGHIVLDGDPDRPSPKGGGAPQFLAHICCGQMTGWIKMPLGREVGLSPSDVVLDGDPAPQFSAHVYCGLDSWMDQDATWHGGEHLTTKKLKAQQCHAVQSDIK